MTAKQEQIEGMARELVKTDHSDRSFMEKFADACKEAEELIDWQKVNP